MQKQVSCGTMNVYSVYRKVRMFIETYLHILWYVPIDINDTLIQNQLKGK